jgi:hypothetical protein
MSKPAIIPLYPAAPDHCSSCIHSAFEKGYSATREEPGEPDAWYCTHEAHQDNQDGAGEDAAKTCPGYIARVIEQCAECKGDMHEIVHTWPHWATGIEGGEPVCGPECKAAFNAGMAKFVEEWEVQGWA